MLLCLCVNTHTRHEVKERSFAGRRNGIYTSFVRIRSRSHAPQEQVTTCSDTYRLALPLLCLPVSYAV